MGDNFDPNLDNICWFPSYYKRNQDADFCLMAVKIKSTFSSGCRWKFFYLFVVVFGSKNIDLSVLNRGEYSF